MTDPAPERTTRPAVLCLGAALVGGLVGVLWPAAEALSPVVGVVLAALLFTTFVLMPLTRIGAALRDLRFLGTVLALNVVIAPVVVGLLALSIPDNRPLLVGLLFVLLAPCVDYVVVFAGLAGGDRTRLLAATPLLLLAQILLVPLAVTAIGGADIVAYLDPGPVLTSLALLLGLPLIAALAVQLLDPRLPARVRIERTADRVMVPLTALTVGLVAAAHSGAVLRRLPDLWIAVALSVAFAVIMTLAGALTTRAARLDPAGARSAVFSGVTRNSLVVLPIALALPPELALVPLVVVTQTLTELCVLPVLVRVLPRLVPRLATS